MTAFNEIKPSREIYDRNASLISINYFASAVAPHATTIRATYTVPAGRRFKLGNALTNLVRSAIAAPVGVAATNIRELSGTRILNLRTWNNIVGDIASTLQSFVGEGVILFPTQGLDITTQDAGTGGTIDYNIGVLGTEFDPA